MQRMQAVAVRVWARR